MSASGLSNPLTRLFAGAVMISFSPIWVELVDISATSSAFYRVAIGGVALMLYLLFTGQRFALSRRVIVILCVAAFAFALDMWFWHRSINAVGPGLATLLANFQVFFMILAGALWLGHKPNLRQLIAVPIALIGLGMIIGFDWRSLPEDYRLGVIFGLLAAMGYAGYMLSMRAARQNARHAVPIREVAFMSLAAAAMLAISAVVEGESLAVPSVIDSVWLFNYGVVSHGLGLMLIASSLPKVSPTQAGIALLLQPILSFIWDAVFFSRAFTPTEVAGAMLALAAIYLGLRPKSRPA